MLPSTSPSPAAPPRCQIFISYSRDNLLTVRTLVEDLRNAGYNPWMDVEGIEVGEAWREELRQQVSASVAVVACVSPGFLASPHCQEEIEQARRENKPIYPVLVSRLPSGQTFGTLSDLQYIDLTADYRAGLRRLKKRLPRERFVPRLAARRALLASLALVFIAAFVAVVAAGPQINRALFGPPPSPTPTPSLEGYSVGVAVGYFAASAPQIASTREADVLIDRFSRLLEQELSAFGQRLESGVSFGYLGPAIIGRIEGASEQARKTRAGEIARDFGADIVVYGAIERTASGQLVLKPEFYIDPYTYPGAGEMTGHYRFGTPIPVAGLQGGSAQTELSARTRALASVIDGLAQYANDRYTPALNAFAATADVPGWDTMTGREVVHILSGNVYLSLAGQATLRCDRAEVLAQADLAIAEFEAANAITNADPDTRPYARPYTGTAAALLLRARWLPPENDGCADTLYDTSPLRDGLAAIDEARRILADDATSSEDVIKVRMWSIEASLEYTVCALLPGDDFDQDEIDAACAQAERVTQQIIDVYEDQHDPTVAGLAAQAYGMRGDLEQLLRQDYYAAIEDYDSALAVEGIYPEHRMFYTRFKGDCYYWLGQFANAADQYEAARQQAMSLRLSAHANLYEALRDMMGEDVQQTREP